LYTIVFIIYFKTINVSEADICSNTEDKTSSRGTSEDLSKEDAKPDEPPATADDDGSALTAVGSVLAHKAVGSEPDSRLATSPPCEVSSTTLTTAEQKRPSHIEKVVEGIIADSNGEKVIIDDLEVDDDEVPVDVDAAPEDKLAVEPEDMEVEEVGEIDDVEPDNQLPADNPEHIINTKDLVAGGVSITKIKRNKTTSVTGSEKEKESIAPSQKTKDSDNHDNNASDGAKRKSTNSEEDTSSSGPDQVLSISKIVSINEPKEGVPQVRPEARRHQAPSPSTLNNQHHPFFAPRLPGGYRPLHPMGPRGPMLPLPGQRMMMRGQFRGHSPGPHGPGVLPNLQTRPGGPLSLPPSLPSSAGPVAEQLNKVAAKLAESLKQNLKETFANLGEEHAGDPDAAIKRLQMECEKIQWRHQQEMAEIKHNADLVIMEMRSTMEQEKQKALHDCRKQAEIDKQKAILEMKKKQWCSHCGKEAIFYCCWNTSYCDYPCQQAHWPSHMATCSQTNQEDDAQDAPEQKPAPVSSALMNSLNRQPNTMAISSMSLANSGVGMPPSSMGFVMPGMGMGMRPGMGMRSPMGVSIRPGMPGQLTISRPYFM